VTRARLYIAVRHTSASPQPSHLWLSKRLLSAHSQHTRAHDTLYRRRYCCIATTPACLAAIWQAYGRFLSLTCHDVFKLGRCGGLCRTGRGGLFAHRAGHARAAGTRSRSAPAPLPVCTWHNKRLHSADSWPQQRARAFCTTTQPCGRAARYGRVAAATQRCASAPAPPRPAHALPRVSRCRVSLAPAPLPRRARPRRHRCGSD
jgi:hypothetical protein